MIWSAIAWLLAGMIIACLLVSIATDLADRIIPNRVVLVVLVCGLALRSISGPGPLSVSLLGAMAVLAALGLLATYDLLGWGDVKLIAAVTLAVPADRVIALLFAITLAGGLLSSLYLILRFALRRMTPALVRAEPTNDPARGLQRLVDRERGRILANEPMPYALAVLAGTAFSLAIA